MKKLGFLALIAFGLTAVSLSYGSVPPAAKTTADTAIYQNNAEITTPRQGRLTFDQDLKNLNEMERKYHERLPRLSERPELASPIKRISSKKYHHSQRAGRAAPIRKVKAVRKTHASSVKRIERADQKILQAVPHHEHGPKVIFADEEREHPRTRD